jgi:phage terminase large subunit-like protein
VPDKITKRWTRSEADEHAVSNGCTFDEAAANHVVEFFSRHLRHTIGRWAGQRFSLLPWQRDDVVMPLFGWMDSESNRRYRLGYVEIAKKNGKSTLCAGLGLYLLAGDGEPAAEVYCAAADRNQAGIVYREASNMAKASPLLKNYIIPRDSVKNLALPSSNSFLRVISRDAFTAEGLNVHGLIFDELHAQKTRDLWDTLRYGGVARRQPLLVSITTAGWDKLSICYEQHQRAMKILDGSLVDDRFFAYVCAADEDVDDWTEPETWAKANPSLGAIIREEDLAEDCTEAQESPVKENTFKRYRLNIWTEQEVRWLQMEKWDACLVEFSPESLAGRPCFAGLDLASTSDTAALALFFPEDGNAVLPFFYCPREGAELRTRRDRVPYLGWAKEGHLTLTPGNVTDYRFIRNQVRELGEVYNIRAIAVDRWDSTQLQIELKDDGFDVVPFGQGIASMNAPTKQIERDVLGGDLRQNGHPVMRWQVGNVAVRTDDAGNIKPSKEKSGEKIDGPVALIMARGLAMLDEGPGDSVYDSRGVLTI